MCVQINAQYNLFLQAMDYIHNSNIKYHGHLTSMNCVIDSRFVLKVTEFGIQSLRDFDIDITKKGVFSRCLQFNLENCSR